MFEDPTPLRGIGRRLHIGGEVRKEGWEVLNVVPGPHVDHLGDCADLARFDDGTFAEVYASHVLEHLGYQAELPRTLREIRRVLGPAGILRASVPNFTLLCKLFVHPDLDFEARYHIMRVTFGGQMDAHDFHKIGFSWELLQRFLREAGFSTIRRVKEHGLFDDTSSLILLGNFLSLNVEAIR